MAYVIINDKHLEAIANALRKVGGKETYKPREMAPDIERLSGGTGFNGLLGKYFIGVDIPGAAVELMIKDCINEDGVLFLPENMWTGKTIKGDVVIPYGIVEIPDEYFKDTLGITDVTFPLGLTTIGASAFENAINGPTDTITFTDVETIGERAFANSTFKELVSHNDTLTIGTQAFHNSSIETIELDGDVSIGASAFAHDAKTTDDAKALKKVTINGTVVDMGSNAFKNNVNLTEVNGEVLVSGGAFENCGLLKAITLNDNATSIGASAFKNCQALETITMPQSVTSIGSDAFYGCENLADFEIPSALETIGDSAFGSCSSLTRMEFPNTLKTIGEYAFSNCENLATITLPEGLETIGEYAFASCPVTKMTIPGTVELMGAHIFGEGPSLKTLTLSEGIEKIGSRAFYGIINSAHVYCPSTLKYIDYEAFKGSEQLSITLNEGLLRIEDYAFYGTAGAGTGRKGEIPSTVGYIGSYAYAYTRMGDVTIPSGVTELEEGTFHGSQLGNITLNEGLKLIGHQCFADTYITELSCPASLERFHTSAFSCDESSSGYPDYNYYSYLKKLEFNLSPDHQLVLDNTGSYYSLTMSDEATASNKNYITFKGQGGQIPRLETTRYSYYIFGDETVNHANTVISVPWDKSENPAGFPWGATKATIIYNNGL